MIMRPYLPTFLLLLLSLSLPTWAADTESASQKTLTELTQHIEALTEQTKVLKGDRLSIVQLEIYNNNNRLRNTIANAMDDKDHDNEFLIQQVHTQVKSDNIYLSYVEKRIDQIQDNIDNSAKDQHILLQIPLNEMRIAQAKLYDDQYQNYQWLDKLGEDQTANIDQLKTTLKQLAQFTAASLNYSLNRKSALQAQVETLPADQKAAFDVELSYLQRNIDNYSKSLSIMVDTAEELDLDVVALKHQLFVATGDITHDLLSWKVIQSSAVGWGEQLKKWFITNSPNMLFNLFMFVLIMGIARVVSKTVQALLKKAVKAPHLKLSNLMQQFILSMSVKIIFCIALLIALAQIGLDLTPVIAGLGVAGIIIGFALQDTLSNFASGMMLLIYRPFDEGDWVNAGSVEGTVSHVSLVNTTIRTFDNEVLLVPNSKIWTEVIINRTYEKVRRVDMVFGISYKDSIPKAEAIFEQILSEDRRVLKAPAPMIKLDTLGDSSVNFIVRPWVRTDDYMDVKRDCTREVKMRFDAEGINIPFPQRDVHLHIVNPDDQLNFSTNSTRSTD
ncbi:mechanosensitive ion channel family protein [Vibrio rumoiensis]|nr:mechanosensitive ion channel family protein [Vibrio rumoiensis]